MIKSLPYSRLKRILCDLLARLHEGFIKGAIANELMSVKKLGNYSSTSYVTRYEKTDHIAKKTKLHKAGRSKNR